MFIQKLENIIIKALKYQIKISDLELSEFSSRLRTLNSLSTSYQEFPKVGYHVQLPLHLVKNKGLNSLTRNIIKEQ